MKNVENQSNIYQEDQHKKNKINSHLVKLHIYREKKMNIKIKIDYTM